MINKKILKVSVLPAILFIGVISIVSYEIYRANFPPLHVYFVDCKKGENGELVPDPLSRKEINLKNHKYLCVNQSDAATVFPVYFSSSKLQIKTDIGEKVIEPNTYFVFAGIELNQPRLDKIDYREIVYIAKNPIIRINHYYLTMGELTTLTPTNHNSRMGKKIPDFNF